MQEAESSSNGNALPAPVATRLVAAFTKAGRSLGYVEVAPNISIQS